MHCPSKPKPPGLVITTLTPMYKACLDLHADFQLRPTHAFGGVPEFAVFATKLIPRQTTITGLEGILIEVDADGPLSPSSLRSTIESRYGPTRLAGPISRVNHQCRQFNAVFAYPDRPRTGSVITIRATKQISVGEEITVTYSSSYFGLDNADCLCYDCEQHGIGGWSGSPLPHLGRSRTRKDSVLKDQTMVKADRICYRSLDLPPTRVPGDYIKTLRLQDARRCIVPQCQVLCVELPATSICHSCATRILATHTTTSAMMRYFKALLSGKVVLGHAHTSAPFQNAAEYLSQLDIPGWNVAPRILCFYSSQDRDDMIRKCSLQDGTATWTVDEAASKLKVDCTIWLVTLVQSSVYGDGSRFPTCILTYREHKVRKF